MVEGTILKVLAEAAIDLFEVVPFRRAHEACCVGGAGCNNIGRDLVPREVFFVFVGVDHVEAPAILVVRGRGPGDLAQETCVAKAAQNMADVWPSKAGSSAGVFGSTCTSGDKRG